MDIVYPDKYYDKVKEKFPELSETQIEKIILYGIRFIFMMSQYNVDIKLQQTKFFMYFGHLFQGGTSYMKYRRIKLTAKTRMLYSRDKKPFNGKYYFLLAESLYEQLPNKKKGKFIPFKHINIYKLRKEAELEEGSYLYEVDYPEDIGYKKKLPRQDVNYRLIAKRDDKKFQFIPVGTENKKEKTVKRSKKKGDK